MDNLDGPRSGWPVAPLTSEILHAIIDSTSDAIFAKDLNGVYLLANEAAARFVGRTIEDFLGHDDSHLFSPEDVVLIREQDARVLVGGESITFEETGTTYTGERVFLTSKSVLRNNKGEIVGLVGIAKDITERRRAQMRVRELEERFRIMFLRAAAGIVLARPDGTLIEVNPAYAHMLGYEPEELVGTSFLAYTHPDDIHLHLEPTRQLMNNERSTYVLEKRYVRIDGAVLNVRITASLLEVPDGPDLMIGLIEDVTEESRIQREREYVLERERALAAQAHELEGWRTSFLRIMAHELRSPLGQIVRYVDMAAEESELLTERGRQNLANIDAAAGRLQALVDRMFEVLALHSDWITIQRSRVDLREITAEAIALSEQHVREAGVTVQIERPEAPCTVRGDGTLIQRALSELLDNAVNASQPGGTIVVRVASSHDALTLSVRDSGRGMAEHIVTTLLEGPIRETVSRRTGGAGLGLLLVRRIAELHDGHLIHVPMESGTCMQLSFPHGS